MGKKEKQTAKCLLVFFLQLTDLLVWMVEHKKTFAQLFAHIKLHKSMAESAINSETSYYIKYVKMKGTPIINS